MINNPTNDVTSDSEEGESPSADTAAATLRLLARSYGIEPSYRDVDGCRTTTPTDALLAVLRSLGAPVERREDIGAALVARRHELAARLLPRAAVLWEESPATVRLRWLLPAGALAGPDGKIDCALEMEDGGTIEWAVGAAELAWTRRLPDDGSAYLRGCLPLPAEIPLGYHRLRVRARGTDFEAFVISAPQRSHPLRPTTAGGAEEGPGSAAWGIQAPLYTLRGSADRGMGDLRSLGELIRWTGEKGGSIVGLLPVLATFADDPSPYSPASRLFWNEMYVDLEAGAGPGGEAPRLDAAAADFVDYPAVWQGKRRLLQQTADGVFAAGGAELDELRGFVEANPTVELYARFRAAGDRYGNDWGGWPEAARDGEIAEHDYDQADYRYHLYGQFRADRDWRSTAADAARSGVRIYMDLPLGAPGRSFDAWSRRSLFAPAVAIGAPPDPFFESGQNWALCPVLPEACRAEGYDYLRAVFRHHMGFAGVLRIDHVMGMHRQYWIPDGFEATDGAYVRTRPDELWAIMVLESQRQECALVGEDLGTVPASVRAAMDRHSVMRTYVLQTELPPHSGGPQPPPQRSLAALNTHDMPPFAAFWAEQDIDLAADLGRYDVGEADARRGQRESVRCATVSFLRAATSAEAHGELEGPEPAMSGPAAEASTLAAACLEWLAASRAQVVMVDLNDLWGETRQQNVPGTYDEHPNWRARSRYALSELDRVAGLAETLEKVDALRRRAWLESKEG